MCVADIDEEKGDQTVTRIRGKRWTSILERCDTSDEEAVKKVNGEHCK